MQGILEDITEHKKVEDDLKYNSPLLFFSEDGKKLKPVKKINDIMLDKISVLNSVKVEIGEFPIKLKDNSSLDPVIKHSKTIYFKSSLDVVKKLAPPLLRPIIAKQFGIAKGNKARAGHILYT